MPTVDPLHNVEHAVSCIRKAGDRESQKLLLREFLRGQIDYASAEGRALGNRRALLCSRLAAEGLWP